MNVLIVDDEKVQIETLRRGLRSKGHKVFSALSAEEAMTRLEENCQEIDFVITDYLLDGDDGLSLLRKIREKYGRLPVIMMTAYGEKKVLIDALRNGCNGFLEKPFTLDDLAAELARVQMSVIQNTPINRMEEILPYLVHQVNNPLNAIMASAYLAMNKPYEKDSLKVYMEHIIDAINNIKDINKKIGLLSRPAEEYLETVDILALVESCARMFDELLVLKGVTFDGVMGLEDECMVKGNAFELEQVFKNLILNAIDSMDGCAGKALNINLEKDPGTGGVKVLIRDSGGGIGPDNLDKIFNQYFTTKEQGTGLGLHVVKSIVEKHRGKVAVESVLNRGTVFSVVLPLADRG